MTVPETPERRGLLPRFTLKQGDTFLLADAIGDVRDAEDGMFTNDTRVLSRYELRIAGGLPSLLGTASIAPKPVIVWAYLSLAGTEMSNATPTFAAAGTPTMNEAIVEG